MAERTVWSKYEAGVPEDAVNIMRPSIWGNPFSHQDGTTARYKVATREEAVARYAEWLWSDAGRAVLSRVRQLAGKHLVCCCKPKACHGDELELLANHDGRDCAKCGEEFEDDNESCMHMSLVVCRRCWEEL